MPSAALTGAVLGAALLAGCQKQPPHEILVTVDITGSPAAIPTAQVTGTPGATPVVPRPAPTTPYQHFQASGNEPFWSMEVLPGQLRYSSPDQPGGVTFAATSSDGLRFAGTLNNSPVTLFIAPGLCSDGMSDHRYPYSAVVTIGAQSLHGCARAE